MSTEDGSAPSTPDGFFRTTHWSVVLQAQQDGSSQTSTAMETLCRTYWYPIYVFVRRRGVGVDDAQDLTQEFFARMLERDFLRNVSREKGRFRSFLLKSLQNFLTSEWHRGQAAKRGGGKSFISWDELRAEERYQHEPVENVTPEHLYERQWALTVMEQAIGRLGEEFQRAGKGQQFESLKRFLSAEGSKLEYAELAQPLAMNASAIPVAVHRMRRRFGELIRTVVAHTVAAPDDVEHEVQALAKALEQC